MTWTTVFCTLYLYTTEFSGEKPAWAFGKHQGSMRLVSYRNTYTCSVMCHVVCIVMRGYYNVSLDLDLASTLDTRVLYMLHLV
jgi:hypothetical protein